MSLKLAARLVTVVLYKIAELQEDDTATHIEDISAYIPKETKAILVRCLRLGGTGILLAYPMSGPTIYTYIGDMDTCEGAILPITNREIKWKLSIANDQWDVYLLGYFVQKRTR